MGIELKATLKARKLLIPLNAKNAKNTGFAQPRYTRGTRKSHNEISRTLASEKRAKASYFRSTKAHPRPQQLQPNRHE